MNITGTPAVYGRVSTPGQQQSINFSEKKTEPSTQAETKGISLGSVAKYSAAALALMAFLPIAKGEAYEHRGVRAAEIVSALKEASAPVVIEEQALPRGITANEVKQLLAPFEAAGIKTTVIFAKPEAVFKDFPVALNRFDEKGNVILRRPRLNNDAALKSLADRLTASNPEARNAELTIVLSQIPRLYSKFLTPDNQIPEALWDRMSPQDQLVHIINLGYEGMPVDLTMLGAVIIKDGTSVNLDEFRAGFNKKVKSMGPRSASVRDSLEQLAELPKLLKK